MRFIQQALALIREEKLYSAMYIGIMLIVDLVYGILDPRIRISAKGGDQA